MTRIEKIGSLFFLILLIGAGVYLLLFPAKQINELKINSIVLNGNNFFSKTEYLQYSHLDEKNKYENLSLAVIKSRIEKHPYIKNATVKLKERNSVIINITEKKIIAYVVDNEKQYYSTDNFEVLPYMGSITSLDIPLITNVKKEKDIFYLSINKCKDMIDAYKIIEASSLTNKTIGKKISEINMNNGGNIILRFTGVEFPIIFGRNNESIKIAALESLWGSMVENGRFYSAAYLDLRFNNKIFIGNAVNMSNS